jgi:hypothetical protein
MRPWREIRPAFHRAGAQRSGPPSLGWTARLNDQPKPIRYGSVLTAVTLLPTLAAGLRRASAILREVAGIVRGTATAVAVLTALASGFRCTLPVVGEIARAVLPTNVTGARCPIAIFREVAWIPRMSLFGHSKRSFVFESATGSPVATPTDAVARGCLHDCCENS